MNLEGKNNNESITEYPNERIECENSIEGGSHTDLFAGDADSLIFFFRGVLLEPVKNKSDNINYPNRVVSGLI